MTLSVSGSDRLTRKIRQSETTRWACCVFSEKIVKNSPRLLNFLTFFKTLKGLRPKDYPMWVISEEAIPLLPLFSLEGRESRPEPSLP